MNHRLAQHYGKLSGDERFRLALMAFARGDDREVTELGSSCPHFTYSMIDNEFSGRIEASQKLVMLLNAEIAPALRFIRFLDAQAELTEACFEQLERQAGRSWLAGYVAAGGDKMVLDTFMSDFDAKPSALERSWLGSCVDAQGVTARLRNHWARIREDEILSIATALSAFDSFTKSTWGMAADEVLKAHSALIEDVSPYQEEITGASVDADQVKIRAASFSRAWNTLMHQEQDAGNA